MSLNVNTGRTFVAIYTNYQLDHEILNISTNPAGGAAILEVYILFLWESPLPSLQHYLTLVPNIVRLELHANSEPQAMATSLVGIHLPHLRILHTTYDHRFLVDFLANHPTLEEVRLFTCAAPDICPLQDLDLSHITSFAGPTDCVAPHIHHGCSRMEVGLTSERCMRPSTLLSTLPSPLQHLQVLILDFNHMEYDLLERIIVVAPFVQSLTLHERLSFNHRPSPRRPWSNSLPWARGLRQLPRLEKLKIRTASTFAFPVGDIDDERTTIMCWVTGVYCGAEGGGVHHPMLKEVAVWYRAIECGAIISLGVISYWSKPTGEWERTNFVTNPQPMIVIS